jgi:hypothetical protein
VGRRLLELSCLDDNSIALVLTNTTIILYDERETLDAVLSSMSTTPLGSPNTNLTSAAITLRPEDGHE